MRSISLSWFAYKVIKVDCLRLDDADKHWKITHCLGVHERALLLFEKISAGRKTAVNLILTHLIWLSF
jgi:hypothetical protein